MENWNGGVNLEQWNNERLEWWNAEVLIYLEKMIVDMIRD